MYDIFDHSKKAGALMKRLFAIFLTLTLVLSLSPMVMAAPDDGILTENGGAEYNFYRGQPKTWDFTPSQTATYLLSIPSSGTLIGQIVGQTPTEEYDLQTGQHMISYDLTGGTTYQVKIEMNPDEPGDMVKDGFNIVRKKPLERLVLNSTTLTMQRDQFESLYVEVEPNYYSLAGLKWTSSDSSVLEIDSTEGNTCNFWARKVGTAKLTATLGDKSASCTVTVEKATGEWDDYEVWPATQTKKKLTMTNGQPFSYTPNKTGTYAMHEEGDIHVGMRGTSPSHMLNSRRVDTLEGDYELVDLIAGETYVFEVTANSMGGNPCTGTAYIEQAREISDIIFYGANMTDVPGINGYVGGMKELYAASDPIYAYGLHGGFQYSSSNEAIADPNDEEGATQHIMLYQEGTCKITVSCGPVSKSLVATVKPSPVLKAGTTTKLEFDLTDAYGVVCLFTPEKSANYTFTVKGTGGTCYIEDTNIGAPIYGSGSMSGWLQAGKTYRVNLGVGESDHTVSVSGGGAVAPTQPTTPTQPTAPTQPDDPDQPSNPTQPSDPIQPTDPNTPTVPTAPTQPVQPTQPTAPVDPALEELAQQMGGSFDGKNIQMITTEDHISLSVSQLAQLARGNGGLVVHAGGIEIRLDTKVLDAVTQTGDETVTVQVQQMQTDSLAQAQRDALQDKEAALVIGVSMGDIHDFAGGKASITVPFTPEAGKAYAVYYLAQDGTLEKVTASYTDTTLTFTTGHFSEYVVLEEESTSDTNMGGADGPEDVSVKADWLPWVLIAVAVVAVAAVVVTVVLKKKKK